MMIAEKAIGYENHNLICFFNAAFTKESVCQYNIMRVNPVRQMLETLKTFNEEECEGGVMSMQFPEVMKERFQ